MDSGLTRFASLRAAGRKDGVLDKRRALMSCETIGIQLGFEILPIIVPMHADAGAT